MMVRRTTSLASTSSTAMPRPAWIWAPRSTAVSACREAGESTPSACAAANRSFTLLPFLPLFSLMIRTPFYSRQLDARPGFDGRARAHHVHSGIGKALQRQLGLRREVSEQTALAVRHRHRRHAIG